MLGQQNRLRGRTQLNSTLRDGVRIKGKTVLFHVLREQPVADLPVGQPQPRVAFAVSRRVGGSVERHRVARRLRHVAADYLTQIPAGTSIVVRAFPSARRASKEAFEADFGMLVRRLSA